MANLEDVPTVHELITATAHALRTLGGSGANDEIHETVVRSLGLAGDVVELSHKPGSNDTRLGYRLRWARTYLKKAGAADNSGRGVWTLTSAGRSMSDSDLAEISKKVRHMDRMEREAKKAKPVQADEDPASDEDQEEISWSEHLLSVLQEMRPDGFERLCQRVLRESGFTRVEVTGQSGDGGIDGHGVLRMNLISFQVLFQAKRFKGSVGSSVVRDFRGAMQGRADKGLIITTGRFTSDARKEATRDGAPAIDLIDGEDLCDLLKSLELGVTVRMVEEIEIDAAVFEAI